MAKVMPGVNDQCVNLDRPREEIRKAHGMLKCLHSVSGLNLHGQFCTHC